MARTAELKLRTTHDGTQAEASLSRLKSSIDRMGDTIGGKLTSAFLGVFSVEKILQFTKAMDRLVTKVGELANKFREGKISLEEFKQSGASAEQAGFAGEYVRAKEALKAPITNAAIGAMRGLIVGTGLFTQFGIGATAGSASLRRLLAAAMTPQAATFTRQSAETMAQEFANNLSAIPLFNTKAFQGNFQESQVTADAPMAESGRFTRSFSNLQRLGAYAYSGDPVMQVQRDQLKTLRGIERLLKAQNRSILEADSGVMFPP